MRCGYLGSSHLGTGLLPWNRRIIAVRTVEPDYLFHSTVSFASGRMKCSRLQVGRMRHALEIQYGRRRMVEIARCPLPDVSSRPISTSSCHTPSGASLVTPWIACLLFLRYGFGGAAATTHRLTILTELSTGALSI
nr:hypothetical protein CFP56_04561 [Quercus suber]